MKVVVIQESIMQPDLTAAEITRMWKSLENISKITNLEIKYAEGYPTVEQLHVLIGDADAVIGMWLDGDNMSESFLSKHPNLKYVASLGHGWENFDVEMTRKKGMVITNTVYGAQTIAEYAWALLMGVCHHVELHSSILKEEDWNCADLERRKAFGYTHTPQIELYGKTCGIFGLGAIGYAFAKIANGFGMRVISYSRRKKEGNQYSFIEQVDMDTLLKRSDVISIHAPSTPSTLNTFNAETFARMKNGVIIINTARGDLIVEEDLANVLKSGKVYGAGLDVLRKEPPEENNPLFHCDNAIITEHIAWLTRESRIRAVNMAIDNFVAYLNGKPVSVIN